MGGLPTWASALKTLIWQAVGHASAPFLPPRKERQVIKEARLILALHGGLLILIFWSPALALITYAPLAVGQIFLRAFLLAEHGNLPLTSHFRDNTRTTHAAAWLRWLTWNMSFHTEHHMNPAVPHDQLPAFHQILKPKTDASYIKFHRDYIGALNKGPDTSDTSQPRV